MFTGIITDIGEIIHLERTSGQDLRVTIRTQQPLQNVQLGASIACSGVCLTVVHFGVDQFSVDISDESLRCTAAQHWQQGAKLNLERALKVGDELGGHIVTGHVDGIGVIEAVEQHEGSLRLAVRAPRALASAIAAKGSVAVDGVSLTVNSVADEADGSAIFQLNIIPHTAQYTSLGDAVVGQQVNLEIDILARYLARMQTAGRLANITM